MITYIETMMMTGGEKLHGDGETSKKLRPDDTDGSEVPDQAVPDDQSERDFYHEIGIDNTQMSVPKTTRLERQIGRPKKYFDFTLS